MLRLTQEMKLVQKLDFRMIQSLKLLPLTIMQLEQRINQELEMNPMLQLDESISQEETAPDRNADESGKVTTDSKDGDGSSEDFTEADWAKYLEDGFERTYAVREERDPNYEEREPTQTYTSTLADSLMEQLGMVVDNEQERTIGEYVIGSIDSDGFLDMSDEEIAETLEITIEDVRRIVALVQTFDPPGVGARSIRETLMIQLRERGGEGTVAWDILRDQYEAVTQRRLQEIMKAMDIDEDDLREAIETIGSLSPRPGAVFNDTGNMIIVPDVIVEKIEGEYVVYHNDRYTPHLTISPSYRRLLDKNANTPRETRKYLVDKLNSAKWFINSIEQRRGTIMRVATSIVERQHDFFEHGVEHLRPMTLQDIADSIGIAISTVQRVTTGKYMQTPQGVFEMKYFFTQRIFSSDGSEDFSAKSVKEKMKQIIQGEPPKKPLSDQKIADMLNEQGVSISRRAIAKYRDELLIPPARLRKQI